MQIPTVPSVPTIERGGIPASVAQTFSYLSVSTDCVLYHAYWDGTATDHSSYGNNGSLSGGYSLIPAGISLDGIDGLITVAYSSPSLAFTDTFSLEAWYRVPIGGNADVFAQGNFPSNSTQYKFIFRSNDTGFAQAVVLGTGADQSYPGLPWKLNHGGLFLVSSSYTPGIFNHTIVTYDSPSGAIRYYVNSTEITVFDTQVEPSTPGSDFNVPIYIGAHNVNGTLVYSGTFDIGEARIWKKVLSQSNVTSLFNATKQPIYGY